MGQFCAGVQRKCCTTYYYNKLKQDDEENKEDPFEKFQKDHDHFFKEEWFASQQTHLFDPEKFIYIYYGYREDQESMEKYWSKIDLKEEIKHGFIDRHGNEVLVLKWKYLLRRGVPMDKMRAILLDLFKRTYENNELEYKQTINIVFKGQEAPKQFKHSMVFQEFNDSKLEEILKIQVLTEEGTSVLNKICWTLHQTFYQISYNPMVVQIASIMLIFLTEAETYCILHYMLEDSAKLLNEQSQGNNAEEQRALRWHFMMKKEQFERLGKSFFDTVSKKSVTFKNILAHFKLIGFNYNDLFADMINSLFVGYVHFPTVLKFFIMFFNEGIKIYFRMTYALCFMLREEILGCKDSSAMKNLIKNSGLKLNKKQIAALISKGFSLRLVKTKHQLSRYSVDKNNNQISKPLFLPILRQPSFIVQTIHLETIWDYLPNFLKLGEPSLIFSTRENGFSLQHLYKRTQEYQEYAALFFIKTVKGDCFGFFIDQNLKASSQIQYYGTDECFLFKISPDEKVFPSSHKNTCHVYSESKYFMIGSSPDTTEKNFGQALQIDSELNKGITHYCETYDSEPLTSNLEENFIIQELEIYTFLIEQD